MINYIYTIVIFLMISFPNTECLLSENNKGCHLYGKIKFVEYGEDYKVKFVKYGEDLRIKYVWYGEDKVGKWKVVEYGEDYKVKDVWYGQGCD